jgi:hypothetical protein
MKYSVFLFINEVTKLLTEMQVLVRQNLMFQDKWEVLTHILVKNVSSSRHFCLNLDFIRVLSNLSAYVWISKDALNILIISTEVLKAPTCTRTALYICVHEASPLHEMFYPSMHEESIHLTSMWTLVGGQDLFSKVMNKCRKQVSCCFPFLLKVTVQ